MSDLYEELRATGAVHVWRGRTEAEPAPDELLLSAEERRIMAGRAPAAAAHYAGAHAAVRRVLAAYLPLHPRELEFGRATCPRCDDLRHGRPVLTGAGAGAGLEFSLSRSGAHWLLAVTAGFPVGIDLEDGRAIDFRPSADLALTPAELRLLDAQSTEAGRLALFLRCWTRKEAVLKASGIGIIADLRSLEVGPESDGPVEVAHTEPGGPATWVVEDLPMGDGPVRMHGALARPGERAGTPVLIRSRPPAAPATSRTA
ncbi:4'-phosphopantetheinyl transferase family protein [Streptomyces sp. NPDC054932]